MLSKRELEVIDRHGIPKDGVRVPQWDGASSVYYKKTGKLWVHDHTPRRHTLQEFYFHSIDSVAGTLTRTHPIKLWDLRRKLTARETARLQGFPESFILPRRSYNKLIGNAVAVPCAAHALSRVLDGTEKTYIDLCSGVGGFAFAAHRHNVNLTCVGFSEILPAAIECYRENFPQAPALGDATLIKEFPHCDILFAGFPCQPFSNANSQKHTKRHSRIDFYQTVLNAVEASKCSRIVLENVSNFLTVGAQQWEGLKTGLEALGFHLETGILNAADFNLPQIRRRVYIVGKRGTHPLKFCQPKSGEDKRIRDILERPLGT